MSLQHPGPSSLSQEHRQKGLLKKLRKMEGALEQHVRQMYVDFFNHEVSSVSCHFISSLELYVFVEGHDLAVERFLHQYGTAEIAEEMYAAIDDLIQKKLNYLLKQTWKLIPQQIATLQPRQPEQLNLLVSFNFDGQAA